MYLVFINAIYMTLFLVAYELLLIEKVATFVLLWHYNTSKALKISSNVFLLLKAFFKDIRSKSRVDWQTAAS